jgi:hypothetical protein
MPAGSTALRRRWRHPPACWLADGAWAPAKVDGERAVCTKCSREALYNTTICTVRFGESLYCGLLYSGCGHKVSWEIPCVAYSPVYFRLK